MLRNTGEEALLDYCDFPSAVKPREEKERLAVCTVFFLDISYSALDRSIAHPSFMKLLIVNLLLGPIYKNGTYFLQKPF